MTIIRHLCVIAVLFSALHALSDRSDILKRTSIESAEDNGCGRPRSFYVEVRDITEPGSPVFSAFFAACVVEHKGYFHLYDAGMIVERDDGTHAYPDPDGEYSDFYAEHTVLPVTQARVYKR